MKINIKNKDKEFQLVENIKNVSRQNGMNIFIDNKNNIYTVCKVKEGKLFIYNFIKDALMEKNNHEQRKCLFEALGNGYTDSQVFGSIDGYPYCLYQILPLTHSFEQKVKSKFKFGSMNNRPIKINDFVQGNSFIDKKSYKGLVKKFKRDEYNDIVGVVILNMKSGTFKTLDPKSVHLSAPFSHFNRNVKWINSANLNIPGSIGGSSY